jgi:hypothetical protein
MPNYFRENQDSLPEDTVDKENTHIYNLVAGEEMGGRSGDLLNKCVDFVPEELARQILEENPDAIEAFGSLEDMVAYIREAMAANYLFESKSGVEDMTL